MAGGDEELYVYAFAAPGLPGTLRIRGHSLRTLTIDDVDVVVERRRGRLEPALEALQEQHDVVTSLAARAPTLLPARFGSLVREATLRSIVGAHRSDLAASLARVRDCEQMTIRVFGAPDVGSRVPDPSMSGTAFLQHRRERAHYVPAEVEVIRRTVGESVVEERVEPGQGRLRVTVFHLVRRDAVKGYQTKASALQALLDPHKVTVTGPWPAFAFSPELL
jgi:hypothetical protein